MVLVALIVIAIVVIGLCFMMSPEDIILSDGKTTESDPNTGLFLGFIYILLGLAVVVTLFTAITSFATGFSTDKKGSLIGLGGVAALALLMLLTYATGNGEAMQIVGYEGDENTPGYLKMCDMFLRTAYILVGIAVVAIIASPFAKKLN